MESTDALHALRAFRCSLYDCLHRRADALFELTDAVLTPGAVPSPVHLSLEAPHRHGWGSLYAAALLRGQIDAEALRVLLASHRLGGSAATVHRTPVYDAVDMSVCGPAATRRGVVPSAVCTTILRATPPASRSWPAGPSSSSPGLTSSATGWTAPVDAQRVRPAEEDANEVANEVAATQVKAFLCRSSEEEESAPLFVFDADYDPVRVHQGLEGWPCQILVRLRAGRRFYADPSFAGPPALTGRPRRHGPKMKCADPSTWPKPSAEHECEDAGYGAAVRVGAWANLHPKVRAHAGRGSRGSLPIVVGTLVLVEVERLPRGERRREPRVLWLWWHGPKEATPNLELIWRSYVRRLDLEHTLRLLTQTLGWTTPRVRHPEQADRWRWLVLAAFAQLRLARARVADRRLPWERR